MATTLEDERKDKIMIKLDTLKVEKREVTKNWNELVLYALDNYTKTKN